MRLNRPLTSPLFRSAGTRPLSPLARGERGSLSIAWRLQQEEAGRSLTNSPLPPRNGERGRG